MKDNKMACVRHPYIYSNFIEFLKRTELFDHFVEKCPLVLTSPNASENRDILGTILFSVLAGHTHYAHMTHVKKL